eukprot:Nk52_evm31s554 gene=Nk52_evmTU31s554
MNVAEDSPLLQLEEQELDRSGSTWRGAQVRDRMEGGGEEARDEEAMSEARGRRGREGQIVYTREMYEALEKAVVLLEDGIAGRSIFHRMDSDSLWYYHLYHYGYFEILFYTFVGIDLLLPLFEEPSAVWDVNPWLIGGIELTCLLTFSIDLFLKIRIAICGETFFRETVWNRIYALALLVSFCEFFLSVWVTFPFSLRKFLRPFFLAQHSSLMKKTLKNMINTLPAIGSVFGLVLFHITFFSLAGMLLFGNTKEGDEKFSTLWSTFKELFILLTTANHPSVMMPAYTDNRLSCIYFISFLLIGLYCFMNILTAIIYTSFKENLQMSMQSRLDRRYIAFRGAFELLSSAQRLGQNGERTERGPHGNDISGVEEGRGYEIPEVKPVRTVNSKLLGKCIRMVTSMDSAVVSVLMSKIEGQQLGLFGMGNHSRDALNNSYSDENYNDSDLHLHFTEFYELFEVAAYKATFVKRINDTLPGYHMNNSISAFVNVVGSHPLFETMVNCVLVLNMVVIALELNGHSTVAFVKFTSGLFLVFYAAEMAVRILAIGLRGYMRAAAWVEFDILVGVLVVLFGAYVLLIDNSSYETGSIGAEVGYLKALNVLFLIRGLRIVFFVKVFENILSTVLTLMKSISTLAGVLILAYYIFALIGMQLFAGKIYEGNPALNGTAFAEMKYFPNNFDNFPSALVTLWELMVVNDWYVIMDAHIAVTSKFAAIFFFAWHIISVVMMMNLVVALTLESFLRKWRSKSEKRKAFSSFEILSQKAEYFHAADMLLDMFKKDLTPPSEERMCLALASHQELKMKFLIEEFHV